ncbi:hypothetical protein ACRAWF_04525 [Streptomyces sp. L7]
MEALVQAQISGSLAPEGASRRSVAETVRSLPLPAGVPATTGDVVLEADTAVHLEAVRRGGPEPAGRHRGGNGTRSRRLRNCSSGSPRPARTRRSSATTSPCTNSPGGWRPRPDGRAPSSRWPWPSATWPCPTLIAGRLAESERLFDQRAALEEARGSQLYLGGPARRRVARPVRGGRRDWRKPSGSTPPAPARDTSWSSATTPAVWSS